MLLNLLLEILFSFAIIYFITTDSLISLILCIMSEIYFNSVAYLYLR